MKTNKRKIFWIGVGACVFGLASGLTLIGTVMAEEKEPTSVDIQIDTLSYAADKLPNGIIGKSYPVFEMSATDNWGNAVDNVETLVFAPDGTLLPIQDGRFETAEVGVYSITYTATAGAYTEQETLKIKVVDSAQYRAPYINLTETPIKTAYTGEQVFLPSCEFGAGLGELVLTLDVDYVGVYDAKDTTVYNFEDNQYFVPEVAGEYCATWTVTDLVGSETIVTTDIVISDHELPTMPEPIIPKIAHVGEEITFPVTEAKLYYKGALIYVPVKVYVNDEEVTSIMSFVAEVAGDYTVRYEAENIFEREKKITYESVLHIIEPTAESFVDNYLYLNGFTSSYRDVESEGLEGMVYLLTADGTQGSAEMQFKTLLHEQYAAVEFGVEPEAANFTELYVTFTDSENIHERIELLFKENRRNLVELYVNGIYAQTVDKSFSVKGDSFETSKIGVSFNPFNNTILDENQELLAKVKYNANGTEFKGFSSGKAVLSVSANGITGESRIKLYRIATQIISNLGMDRGAPLYIERSDFANSCRVDVNDSVRVSKLEAFDLFEGTATVSTKITSPSGEVVFDGVLEKDYYFTVTEYGKYSIEYTAYDTARNAKSKGAAIEVVDRIPPTIIAPELPTIIKVGTEYTFPTATVQDNVSEECTTWIYVVNENYGKPQIIDNKYTFTQAGTYIIKYGAADKAGNFTVVEYTIICQ